MKERLFKIGDLSKIFHIPVKTLRFYSDAGILMPAYIDPVSGYRYYSVDQFVLIDIIRNSRKMGLSLNEISTFLKDDLQAADIRMLIEKQINKMNQKIEECMKIRDSMTVIARSIEETENKPRNKVYKSVEPKQYYLSFPYCSSTPEEQELNFRKVALRSGENSEQVYAIYGTSTLKDEYFHTGSIINPDIRNFITDSDNPNVCVQSEGTYACIVFDDNVYQKEKYYALLAEFLQKEKLEPVGDFVEEWIIPRVQDGMESTLIKLKIQIKD